MVILTGRRNRKIGWDRQTLKEEEKNVLLFMKIVSKTQRILITSEINLIHDVFGLESMRISQ